MALIMLCILPLPAFTPPCAHVAFACLSLLLLLLCNVCICVLFFFWSSLCYDIFEINSALKDLADWWVCWISQNIRPVLAGVPCRPAISQECRSQQIPERLRLPRTFCRLNLLDSAIHTFDFHSTWHHKERHKWQQTKQNMYIWTRKWRIIGSIIHWRLVALHIDSTALKILKSS